MPVAISIHLLSAVIWVGGMFFAYMLLRPVMADKLQPPQRLTVWVGVFNRFFIWVWVAIAILIGSGHYMIFHFGGFAHIGMYVHIMMTLAYIMMGIFMHVYFAPFKRIKAAVEEQDWAVAGNNLNQIRKLIAINLLLGLSTVVIASAGRYF